MHALVRTFAGVEYFARVNAQYMRRRFLLGLANDRFSRCCLACFAKNGKRVLDSERHALFDCPSHAAARGRFTLAMKFFRDSDAESTVADLCKIVTYTKHCASRLEELAKFLLNIRMTRRRDHHTCTLMAPMAGSDYCAD